MEILGLLFLFAVIYALLHPLKTLGLILRLLASIVVLVVILAIVAALFGSK